MKTKNTEVAVCHIRLNGLSTQTQVSVISELMGLIHENGGVIDGIRGTSFMVYWSSSGGVKSTTGLLQVTIRRLREKIVQINRTFGFPTGHPGSIQLRSALAFHQFEGVVPVPPSVAGRVLIAQKAKDVVELCAKNEFLGKDFVIL